MDIPFRFGPQNVRGKITVGFQIENNVLVKYEEEPGITEVVIPKGVTQIGCGVFSWCETVTSVTIPESVTEIGWYAFESCRSLKNIRIPTEVSKIESGTFIGCQNLTSVTIPESVTEIGDWAFLGCEKLTIHAPAGSYAEEYAKENEISFAAE